MNKQVKPADIIIMVSGAVALIFSFLPWFEAGEGGPDWTGWSTELTFPLGTYIAIVGTFMAVMVALTTFAGTNVPATIVSFTWTQVYLVLSAFAVLLAIGWLLIDPLGAELDKGIGLWLSILAAIGLLVGAIMRHMDTDDVVTPGGQPPTPF